MLFFITVSRNLFLTAVCLVGFAIGCKPEKVSVKNAGVIEITPDMFLVPTKNTDVIEITPDMFLVPTQFREDVLKQPEREFFFTISNCSQSFVSLQFQGTDCGCVGIYYCDELVKPLTQFNLEPTGSIALSIRFVLPTTVGAFVHQAVFVPMINDKPKEPVTFLISGKILTGIVLEPASIQHDFFEGQPTTVSKTISITRTYRSNKTEQHIQPIFQSLPSSVQVVDIKKAGQEKNIEDGVVSQTWVAVLKITRDKILDNVPVVTPTRIVFGGDKSLSTNTQDIPVLIRKKIGIDFPEKVLFGLCKVGDVTERKIVLRSADDKPFQISSAHCNSTMFYVSGIPSKSSNILWLELFFDSQMTGNCTGEIELKTNHPSVETIKIQLEGLVK